MSQNRRKPSPAMIVAFAALFIALTGSAYAALARNSVRSTTIKNGEVRRPDIRNNAVNSVKVADGSLGVADLSAAAVSSLKPMWAVVNAGGSLARGSAGVTSVYAGASFYLVTFPRDVTGCVYTATIGGTETTYGGKGEISVYSANAVPKGVTVVTHDSAGSFSDRPFHLVVNC